LRSLKEDQEALRREVLEALRGGTSSRGGAVLPGRFFRLFPEKDAFPVENDGGKSCLKGNGNYFLWISWLRNP